MKTLNKKNVAIRLKTCHRRFDSEPLSYFNAIYQLTQKEYNLVKKHETTQAEALRETLSAMRKYRKERKP